MLSLAELRSGKRLEILRIARSHGCTNVRVFGSVACGTNTLSSDIDFLVDLEAGRNLFDLGALLVDLEDALKSKIDVVETRCLHPLIREQVIAEALPI